MHGGVRTTFAEKQQLGGRSMATPQPTKRSKRSQAPVLRKPRTYFVPATTTPYEYSTTYHKYVMCTD